MAVTEKALRDAYKSKPELLEEMLVIKGIEELCYLYDNPEYVTGGAGKTNRFYEKVTGKTIDTSNNTTNSPNTEENSSEKKVVYIAVWEILCGGTRYKANSQVEPQDFGNDFERLLEIGAIGELADIFQV